MLAVHARAGLGGGAHALHHAIGMGTLEAHAHPPRSVLTPPDLGRAGLAAGNLSAAGLDPTKVASRESWLHRAPVLTAAQRALLPLAVVSSAMLLVALLLGGAGA